MTSVPQGFYLQGLGFQGETRDQTSHLLSSALPNAVYLSSTLHPKF